MCVYGYNFPFNLSYLASVDTHAGYIVESEGCDVCMYVLVVVL